jgi:mannosyltransferase
MTAAKRAARTGGPPHAAPRATVGMPSRDTSRASAEPSTPHGASDLAHRHFATALVVTSVAGLLLRFVRLGAQSLWIDEVLSYSWILEIRKLGVAAVLSDIHGPLHALVLALVGHFSTSEWWLRFPSALLGAATVPLLGLLGRALWGPASGLLAAGVLAVSPFALYYSQECRNYAFSMFFATLLLLAARAFVTRVTRWRALGIAVAALGAIGSNLNGLFLVIGVGLWGLWTLRRSGGAWRAWLLVHVVVALLVLPYGWRITHQVHPERLVGVETDFGQKSPLRGSTTLHAMAVPYTAYAFATGYSVGPTLEELRLDARAAARPRYWPLLGLAVLGFGVPFLTGLLTRRRGPWHGLLVVPALVTLGITIWLAAANMKPYNVRYLSVLLPGFLLFVARGLEVLPRRLGAVCAVLALLLSLWSCGNYLFVPRYGRDDVRGAVDYVAAQAAPTDAVLQVSLTGPMRYYYNRLGTRPVHPPDAALASPAAAREFVARTAAGATTVWYLECRAPAVDPGSVLLKTLQSLSHEHSTQFFVGVRVHRFELRPGNAGGSPGAAQDRPGT